MQSGEVEQLLDYYPFGDVRIDEKQGSFSEKRQFAGSEKDTETGLNYMVARYEDPTFGKFLSIDPLVNDLGLDKRQFKAKYNKNLYEVLSDPQQLNSYSYARNNPLYYTDPNGEAIFAAIAAAAYAVFEIGSTVYDVGNLAWTYLDPNSTDLQKQDAMDFVAIGIMVPGSGKLADDIFDIGRASSRAFIKAGDSVAGLKVTKHAAERFTQRSMTKEQIGTALNRGVKYMDNKTGNMMHVVGERGRGGYTIVTDTSQKTLVSVENFVPKMSEKRYTKINTNKPSKE